MFTGLYPTQIKLTGKNLDKLSQKVPVLTELLKDQGYYTICYTENPWINSYFRVTRGFHRIFYNFGLSFFNLSKNKIVNSLKLLLEFFEKYVVMKIKSKRLLDSWGMYKLIIDQMNKRIIRSITWKRFLCDYKNTINLLNKLKHIILNYSNEKPFYLFLNIMATHSPYIPIKKALDYLQITTKDLKVLKHILLNPTFFNLRINVRGKSLTEKQTKTLQKLYDSCVYYCDLIIEKLISIFKKLELLDNTYIIITSDHGDHLCSEFDNYLYGHGVYQSVYDSLIKVPLIIYKPNLKEGIIDHQVELKDLFHTILHLTGFFKDNNEYFDLKKSILYQINNNLTPKYIFGENLKSKKETRTLVRSFKRYINPSLIQKLTNNIHFLRSNSFKYISYEEKVEEFYDLINDPFEKTNIISDNHEEYLKMKLFLEEHLKYIKNPKNLAEILTKKEKLVLRRVMKNIKI